MCANSSPGGATPWLRQTTIGTAQISHSAIQQTSSSWNHGVMRAASHRSQFGSFTSSDERSSAIPERYDRPRDLCRATATPSAVMASNGTLYINAALLEPVNE